MNCTGFKIVFKDETKRLSAIPETFAGVKEAIQKAFSGKIPENFVVKYLDSDQDNITVTSEDDYEIMLQTSKGNVKLFVQPTEVPTLDETVEIRHVGEPKKAQNDDFIPLDEKSPLSSPLELSPNPEPEPSVLSREGSEVKANTSMSQSVRDLLVNNPKLKEAEDKIRAEMAEKEAKKEKKKAEKKRLQETLLDLKETKVEIQTQLLQFEKEMITEKKRANCENLSETDKSESDEKLIQCKASRVLIKSELRELKKKIRETKRELRVLEGKPVHPRKCGRFQGPRPCKEKTDKLQAVHARYTCDGCGVHPIVGPRFKCTICHDFDFCSNCENSKDHAHAFIKIDCPAKAPKFLFALDQSPENIENLLSVHGGDPNNGLGQFLHRVVPAFNQVLQPQQRDHVEEMVQETARTIATAISKPEESHASTKCEVAPQPEKSDISFETAQSHVAKEECEMKKQEEAPKDPVWERTQQFLLIFPEFDQETMMEIIQKNMEKTDDMIAEMILLGAL